MCVCLWMRNCVSKREDSFISGRGCKSMCFCICVSTHVVCVDCIGTLGLMDVAGLLLGLGRSSSVITVILLEPRPPGLCDSQDTLPDIYGSLPPYCLMTLSLPAPFPPLPSCVLCWWCHYCFSSVTKPEILLAFFSLHQTPKYYFFYFENFVIHAFYSRFQHTALLILPISLLTGLPPPGSFFLEPIS